MSATRNVLQAPEMSRVLSRVAFEILERNQGAENLVLLGIPTRGVHIARRIAKRLAAVEPNVAERGGEDGSGICGVLDVTPFRDDLDSYTPREVLPTQLPGSIDGKTIVLFDDVLHSGRTIRAAFDAIAQLGRPQAVRLAVMVDRGHRDFPIRADHVGKNLPTAHDERVQVKLSEVDGEDAVAIERKSSK